MGSTSSISRRGSLEKIRPCYMAKGRKLTTSRSERFLGSFAYGHGHGHGQGEAAEASELVEEDVWSMVDDMVDRDDQGGQGQSEWSPRAGGESAMRNHHRRRIPRDDGHHVGGLSLAFNDSSGKTTTASRIVHQYRPQDGVTPSSRGHHLATSAPVNVPDWHNILRVDSVESLHDSDDDREWEMVPPHEYLAREYAASRKTAATSVLEGVGRTLKGRDMSRVRDAVWSQTGFDG